MKFGISILSFLFIVACVDRIELDTIDQFDSQIVVDGFISDDPGPYTVKIFRTSKVDDNLRNALPFSAKEVSIFDNLGNTEVLEETVLGLYQTKPTGLRGMVGRVYTLRIENRDGTIYESTPELIRPSGSIDSIYHEFESFKPTAGPTEYGFRIFMDSQGEEDSNFFRWKFNGTYRVQTNPELHDIPCGQARCPDPRPCSGYIFNGSLNKVGNCACCSCWVLQVEDSPIVSDNQFVQGGKFNKVEMGFVPMNEFTFYDKYKVEIEQLSLSKAAFDFWRVIKSQKEGATSLFQPAFGQVKTNIFPTNGGPEVLGIFYAAAKARKTIFINRAAVPVPIPDPAVSINEACDQVFSLASTVKPFDWD